MCVAVVGTISIKTHCVVHRLAFGCRHNALLRMSALARRRKALCNGGLQAGAEEGPLLFTPLDPVCILISNRTGPALIRPQTPDLLLELHLCHT
jgi:hypothetical protein